MRDPLDQPDEPAGRLEFGLMAFVLLVLASAVYVWLRVVMPAP